MARQNTRTTRTNVASAITSETTPSGRTHEGAPGYARSVQSELFLLAVTNFGSEATFYESAEKRDERYAALIRQAAVADPQWTAALLRWLRTTANMRTATIVGAAEFVSARLALSITRDWIDPHPGLNRQVIDDACQRADEPAELLAYWRATRGRRTPMPIKRGLADACRRLYTEFAYLKWDSPARGIRMADVVELCHPEPRDARQSALFSRMIDLRQGRSGEISDPDRLPMLARREAFGEFVANDPQILCRTDELRRAGHTWESALSLAGDRVPKAQLWEALIPTMGYMALIRNLRNFDQAGVSDEVAEKIAARLADPEEVARSRQLPLRFLSAYREAPSLRWSWPLEKALDHCLASVPTLAGQTLILVDTSSSMQAPLSARSKLMRWDAAALFGLALARRCEAADVVSFSSAQRYMGDPRGARTKQFGAPKGGESLLRAVTRWQADGYFLGGGTDTAAAVRQHYARHDRVVILTDEQASREDVGAMATLQNAVLHTLNLAGYRYGHAPSGGRNRHTYGGLTDAAFTQLGLVEAGQDGRWPWGD